MSRQKFQSDNLYFIGFKGFEVLSTEYQILLTELPILVMLKMLKEYMFKLYSGHRKTFKVTYMKMLQ